MIHETCPHCGTDLRGDPIPDGHLAAGWYGPWDGQPRWYDRTLGVEVDGAYDGVLYWLCPDCGGTWHRWPEGHDLRRVANPWVLAGRPAAGGR